MSSWLPGESRTYGIFIPFALLLPLFFLLQRILDYATQKEAALMKETPVICDGGPSKGCGTHQALRRFSLSLHRR